MGVKKINKSCSMRDVGAYVEFLLSWHEDSITISLSIISLLVKTTKARGTSRQAERSFVASTTSRTYREIILSSCCVSLLKEGNSSSRSIYLNSKPWIMKTFLTLNYVKMIKYDQQKIDKSNQWYNTHSKDDKSDSWCNPYFVKWGQ